MQSKVILFDIDHTLFNTEKYKTTVFEKLAKLFPDLTEDEVLARAEEVYLQMREVDVFNPLRFAKRLLDRLRRKQNVKRMLSILEDKKLLHDCIYPDVETTLIALSKSGVKMGIFSTGDKELQMKKIHIMGDFFSKKNIHIYPLKDVEIPAVIKQYENERLFVVDDILRVLEEFSKQSKAVKTIWIARKDDMYHNGEAEHKKPDKKISSLTELLSILTE